MKKSIAMLMMVFAVLVVQMNAYACGVGGHGEGEKTEEGEKQA